MLRNFLTALNISNITGMTFIDSSINNRDYASPILERTNDYFLLHFRPCLVLAQFIYKQCFPGDKSAEE
jgi:hypothetical protein